MAFLMYMRGQGDPLRVGLPRGQEIIFGRADEAHVKLEDKNVSRQHARFAWVEGHPVLFDLGSSNGTFVNGLPISQITLMDGDVITMGDEAFRYVEETDTRKVPARIRLKPSTGKVKSVAPSSSPTSHLALNTPAAQLDALYDAYSKLKTLYRTLQSLIQSSSMEELCKLSSDSILLSTHCDRVSVVLRHPNGLFEPLHQAWSRDLREADVKRYQEDEGSGIELDALAEVVERDGAIFLLTNENIPKDLENDLGNMVTSSTTMGAPIKRAGSITGVLYADCPISRRKLTKNDLDLLGTVALQMGDPLGRLQQIEQLRMAQSHATESGREGLTIITRAPVMRPIMQMVRQVAPTDSIALLLGESGTGKEMLARAIHHYSNRREGPFIPVNCAALPHDLIESELFGHEKGAFTGAFTRRPGKFEAANGGTIFLDEIGELPLMAQSKLLRVLQENEIQRIGSSACIKVDARVIAATNVNIEQAVREGRFREDLYYRINVVAIRVPALRERQQDIPVLATYFLEQFRRKMPTSARELSPEAIEAMASYHWPGNVRELRNVIERAVVLSRGETIMPGDLPLEISSRLTPKKTEVDAEEPTEDSKVCSLAEMEKRHIRTVLELTKGNKQHAARLLGISRTTLYEKIKAYELET